MLALLSAPDVAQLREGYDGARAALAAQRTELATALAGARGAKAREVVLERASEVVLEALTAELFPAWVGTPWSFNGTSDRPGEGTIACGMFVGTLLRHAGFVLDRIALGRLASEHIALSLTSEGNLRRYSSWAAADVQRDVEAWGPGLYLVGLDYHAGFILVPAGGKARFIHSSIVGDSAVMDEPLDGPNPFRDSSYRVVARLLDKQMIKKWLAGTAFPAFARRRAA